MEVIQRAEAFNALQKNKIILTGGKVDFSNSKFIFHGENNLVYIYNPTGCQIQLVNTVVNFFGNNSLLFIDAGKFKYTFDLQLFHNSVCHIGANSYFNPYGEIIRFRCAEEKNIFVGDDCMFSTDIDVNTSDSHLIFDCNTLQRVNYAKSIYIGDHVWLGKMAAVLKGSQIGSGAIVGTRSIITKKIPSNTSWAGSPAKKRGENVFFVGYNAQPYKKEDIELHSTYQSDRWVFAESEDAISFEQIENDLNNLENPEDKANYLLELDKNKKKNRFFIPLQ